MAVKKLNKKELDSWLPEKVAERFSVEGVVKGSSKKMYPKFGIVDFKTISLARAEQLVKMEFPYLKKK